MLKYLIENSTFESNLRGVRNELLLVFGNIEISIFFDRLNEDVYDEPYQSADTIDLSILCEAPIEKIIIQEGSVLYYDNDNKERKEYLENYEPYTSIAYDWVRELEIHFPNSVKDFRVCSYLADDSCSMCDDIYEYGFQIEIDVHYWERKDLFDFIIHKNNSVVKSIPSFYDTEKLCKDNYELKYISTNTKTRRIGYLKILLSMFEHQFQIPASRLNRKFELFCQNFEQSRLQYKNTKGNVVVTKNGGSAAPYIELALKLGLIHKGGGMYMLGKTGKAYNAISSQYNHNSDNPFELNILDVLFWSELILREDFWFVYCLLEQAAINTSISYSALKKIFKEILIQQIDNYIDEASYSQSANILKLKSYRRQISNWEKPEVYMEHIIMPRLNWLFDLDYISLKSDLSYSLTPKGYRLLFNISSWSDIELHKVCSPSAFLDTYYLKMMNDVLGSHCESWNKSYFDIFQDYLTQGFEKFRTLAPNRITYSIFVSYLKYNMFIENGIAIDEEDVRNIFESNIFSSYTMKYQSQYKDGYIQKVNNYNISK